MKRSVPILLCAALVLASCGREPASDPEKSASSPPWHPVPGASHVGHESCKTCHHYVRVNYGGIWRKCDLMRKFWTHGPGSDIRAKDPACRHWQARAQEPSKAGKV